MSTPLGYYGSDGNRGERGYPGVGVTSIDFVDNNDGTTELTFNMSNGTTQGPFTNTLTSDNLVVSGLTVNSDEIYIGNNAGDTRVSLNNVGVGRNALSGNAFSTSQFSVGIGSFAGKDNNEFSTGATSVGYSAGQQSGEGNVAIGWESGYGSGDYSVNVGYQTGNTCGGGSVNVGKEAGETNCGLRSTNIGWRAGNIDSNSNNVNIGALAGETNPNVNTNTIIINATNTVLQSSNNNALYISECRNSALANNFMHYNTTTKEVSYSDSVDCDIVSVGTNTVTANHSLASGDNHTLSSTGQQNSILSGYTNSITGLSTNSCILGGSQNSITASDYSTILGGVSSSITTGSDQSTILGRNVTMNHTGSVILKDDTANTISSSADNQLLIEFTNGVEIQNSDLLVDVDSSIVSTFRSQRVRANYNVTMIPFYSRVTSDLDTLCCQIKCNGNLENLNNSYGAISDERLKENIIDAPDYLDRLKTVQIKKYNLIGHSENNIGVIAQDLLTIFPSLVDHDEEEDRYSVKYSVFVPILIKSLQEQQTIIDDLLARVVSLEAVA